MYSKIEQLGYNNKNNVFLLDNLCVPDLFLCLQYYVNIHYLESVRAEITSDAQAVTDYTERGTQTTGSVAAAARSLLVQCCDTATRALRAAATGNTHPHSAGVMPPHRYTLVNSPLPLSHSRFGEGHGELR